MCRIFLDESAPDNVLEVTARAITYYLDVSAECTRRIVAVDGAVKALCNRLVLVEMSSRTSKDLSEQCIKVRHWELLILRWLRLEIVLPHKPKDVGVGNILFMVRSVSISVLAYSCLQCVI